jgi:serine/threonine-protein kinase
VTDYQDRLQQAFGGAYRIERELPLSGLGRAFMATETASGRRVTVQALPPDIASRLVADRFRAAVERVQRLRHAAILPLLAADAGGDLAYCVWPHAAGESVRYRLTRDGGLGEEEAIQVLHDVADALAYGHAQGVVHGDVRPDTIYIEAGRARLAEFGLRAALDAGLGGDERGDAASDVHALAVAGQQMLGGKSPVLGDVLSRALSIDASERFATARDLRDAIGQPPSARRRRRLWRRLGVAGAVVAAIGLLVMRQVARAPDLDPDLIAVAPFEVLEADHQLWGEGLMTVLAGNLDGAGPLRAVSPTLVVRRWQGPAAVEAAVRLARQSGARLALFGRVEHAGGDSLRATATLVDVGFVPAQVVSIQVADAAERMDRVADSLTVRVLRELGRSRPLAATRSASLGASSMPALRAFLCGEQHFRRTEWDSAIADYHRAIELDSTFALALYRAGTVLGWQSTAADSLSLVYLLRAAANLRGLPPRDSFLIVTESLAASLDEGAEVPGYWGRYRRLYATTVAAARRYPDDPEVWYEYADVRYHHAVFSSIREMREAFDRSIALDSAYAPAYIHQIELALQESDPDGALRYIDRYLALRPKDVYADAIRLTRRLLDPQQARSPEIERVLDTASSDMLLAAVQAFRGWADTLETHARIARRLVASGGDLLTPHGRASPFLPELGSALAYHGRLLEAFDEAGQGVDWVVTATAWMGGATNDTSLQILRWSLRTQALYPRGMAATGAPVFAQRRDSVALQTLARRADSLVAAARDPQQRAHGRFVADGSRALLALVRGDTAAAIAGLQALPDTACQRCVLYTVHLAQLLDARRMDVEAARLLARDSPGFVFPTDGFWELYRARLYTRQGNRIGAARSYRFVRDVWRPADAPLQPYVREAEAALARLRG